MLLFKCKMCGGDVESAIVPTTGQANGAYGTCGHCGTTITSSCALDDEGKQQADNTQDPSTDAGAKDGKSNGENFFLCHEIDEKTIKKEARAKARNSLLISVIVLIIFPLLIFSAAVTIEMIVSIITDNLTARYIFFVLVLFVLYLLPAWSLLEGISAEKKCREIGVSKVVAKTAIIFGHISLLSPLIFGAMIFYNVPYDVPLDELFFGFLFCIPFPLATIAIWIIVFRYKRSLNVHTWHKAELKCPGHDIVRDEGKPSGENFSCESGTYKTLTQKNARSATVKALIFSILALIFFISISIPVAFVCLLSFGWSTTWLLFIFTAFILIGLYVLPVMALITSVSARKKCKIAGAPTGMASTAIAFGILGVLCIILHAVIFIIFFEAHKILLLLGGLILVGFGLLATGWVLFRIKHRK